MSTQQNNANAQKPRRKPQPPSGKHRPDKLAGIKEEGSEEEASRPGGQELSDDQVSLDPIQEIAQQRQRQKELDKKQNKIGSGRI